MKSYISISCFLLFSISLYAQAPQSLSYQAVIRDASDLIVKNTTLGVQISILQTSTVGSAVYVETHTPTTNINGLMTFEIGNGTVVSGTFASIDWGAGPYFIKSETDLTGGTTYTITGTSQLLSVPYALYAEEATTALLDSDNQTLSLAINSLSLTNGGSVDLSTYLDNTDTQILSLATNTLSLTNGGNVDLSSFVNTDNQVLSLATNTLALTNGGNVDLSSYLDNTDNQTLSLTGNTLDLVDGGSVDLSTITPSKPYVTPDLADAIALSYQGVIMYVHPTDNATDIDWATAGTTCTGLNAFGQTDWELPSRSMLDAMYKQSYLLTGLEENDDWKYWSSTAQDTDNALSVRLDYGAPDPDPKTNALGTKCRCVRFD